MARFSPRRKFGSLRVAINLRLEAPWRYCNRSVPGRESNPMKATIGWMCAMLLWGMAGAGGVAGDEPPRELARWLGPQQWERDTAGPILSLGAAGDFDDMHIFA